MAVWRVVRGCARFAREEVNDIAGRCPRGMLASVEGVIRWHNRVVAYAVVLATDRYLPFRLVL